ncbi:MAG: hypothetical protein ACREP3_05320 [Candidatus Binatia bacterium]
MNVERHVAVTAHSYQYFARKFSFPTRVSPSGLRNILELLSQRTPATKIDMNLSRYLDEGTLDELEAKASSNA